MKKLLNIMFGLIAVTFLVYFILSFGNATFNLKEMNSDSRVIGAFLLLIGYVATILTQFFSEDFN